MASDALIIMRTPEQLAQTWKLEYSQFEICARHVPISLEE